MALTDFLNLQIGDNSGSDYLMASVSFIIFIVILLIFKGVVLHRLKKLAKKTKTDFDDNLIKNINGLKWPFYVLLSLYISLQFVTIPASMDKFLNHIFIIFVVYYSVKFLQNMFDYAADKFKHKGKKEEAEHYSSVIEIVKKVVKGVLWAVALIIVLSNFGYNVSTLAAGLGIGGLAIAFAFQAILGDIFASFSIYFDKPFRVGDFIIVGNDSGTVKQIGIKTTRIQTLQGQELIISNKELTETRVNNYKKMERRRIIFKFGVEYDTKLKTLKKIESILVDIFKKIKTAELNRIHFKEFGDFSLNFEVVYYVNVPDYAVYMDTQQDINFKLKERFEKEGIEFAFPTQTLLVKRTK